MKIPFTKAHGAKNDFLLTWSGDAPASNLPEIAKRICDRNTGVGADGWLLVSKGPQGADYHGKIRLINSDGSDAEMSGNGTRCAAAFLLNAGIGAGDVTILTGAGNKHLRLKARLPCNSAAQWRVHDLERRCEFAIFDMQCSTYGETDNECWRRRSNAPTRWSSAGTCSARHRRYRRTGRRSAAR